MRLSFRNVLALSLVPAWICSVASVGLVALVFEHSAARVHHLQDAWAAGVDPAEALWPAGQYARLSWLATASGFLGLSVATALATALVDKHLRQRTDALASWLQRIEGGETAAPPPEVVGDDPLARLERTVVEVASQMAARSAQLDEETRRSRFDGKLQRALDLVDTEDEALSLAEVALGEVAGGMPFEVLLADGKEGDLRACAGSAIRPGCTAREAHQCAAVRRGQTLVFDSSREIDACPKLRGRDDGISACCAPLTVMGRTIGVIHATAPDGQPPADEVVRRLESVATHIGGRISSLRTLASSESRAQTDGMTGLWNRRTFEDAAATRLRAHPTAVDALVMVDLDHFKALNDTAGHEAGDRALRLFASVVRGALRESDLVGRYGGEEFVLMLLDCDEVRARAVLSHLRKRLAQAVARYGGPAFTASFGVATTGGASLAELLARADAALYRAKRDGRDRVVTASEPDRVPVRNAPDTPAPAERVRLVEESG
ncbi:MAG: sensor domain-containing diguanylate cyclase [Myxococcota bacterium]